MNCDLYPSEDETYAFVWHINPYKAHRIRSREH